MNFSPVERLMEAITGATIVSGDCTEADGLHLHFADGRVFVVVIIHGGMAMSLLSSPGSSGSLH